MIKHRILLKTRCGCERLVETLEQTSEPKEHMFEVILEPRMDKIYDLTMFGVADTKRKRVFKKTGDSERPKREGRNNIIDWVYLEI
jgi:hypothetical protein